MTQVRPAAFLFYFAYMIYVLKKNNQALLMAEDFDDVFMESPVMNSDSSSPEGLDL